MRGLPRMPRVNCESVRRLCTYRITTSNVSTSIVETHGSIAPLPVKGDTHGPM